MNKVYLAGPITGLAYDEALDWRKQVSSELKQSDILCLSPLRYKSYLDKEVKLADNYEGNKNLHHLAPVLSSSKGITVRDKWDCERCDVMIANLLGAEKVSIGTVMEISWAHAAGNPIVMVMEEEGNVHDHAMIRESIGFRVKTIEDAIEVTKALLCI